MSVVAQGPTKRAKCTPPITNGINEDFERWVLRMFIDEGIPMNLIFEMQKARRLSSDRLQRGIDWTRISRPEMIAFMQENMSIWLIKKLRQVLVEIINSYSLSNGVEFSPQLMQAISSLRMREVEAIRNAAFHILTVCIRENIHCDSMDPQCIFQITKDLKSYVVY
jgi:hypothetical protein